MTLGVGLVGFMDGGCVVLAEGRAVGGGVGDRVGGGVGALVTVIRPCIAAYPWMVQ